LGGTLHKGSFYLHVSGFQLKAAGDSFCAGEAILCRSVWLIRWVV